MELTPKELVAKEINFLLNLNISENDLAKLLSSLLTRIEFGDKYNLTRQMVDLRFRQNELKFIKIGNGKSSIFIIDCEENRNVFTSLR